jgi:hypothetical protein
MLRLCVAKTNVRILTSTKAACVGLVLCAAAVLPPDAIAQTRHVYQEASRHFTAAQAKTIRRVLARRSVTAQQSLYIVEVQCSDCSDYASELIDIITKVPGWAIYRTLVIGYSEEPQSDHGLTLVDTHPDDPTPATLALRDALRAARVPFSIASATKPLDLNGKPGTEIVISRLRRF